MSRLRSLLRCRMRGYLQLCGCHDLAFALREFVSVEGDYPSSISLRCHVESACLAQSMYHA